MRRRNAALAFFGVASVVVVGVVAARPGSKAVAVRESVVRYGNFALKLPETGVVQLPHVVTIPAGLGGVLGAIVVRAGDRARQGQVLATIENDQIASNVADAEATLASSEGKTESVSEASAVLPEQNHSAIVQAEAAVVAARSQLTQAKQDVVAGAQSGLGYGGQTAEEQRLSADAALAKADTDLREAKRTYDANAYLYAQKGLSRDALMQSQARYDEARVSYDQAKRERTILGGTLGRESDVLRERVRSAQDALRQALAALAAARANADESRRGDLDAARAETSRARADLAFARAQAEKLEVRAPFDGTIQSVAAQVNDPLRPLAPGDAVTAGEALFSMAADDHFVVRTKVDEQDVAGIALGQRAVVSGEDFGGATLAGHVVAISPVAQRSEDPSNTSRQVVTTIALDRTLPFLRDGMTVDVDVVTRFRRHVLTVPNDALRKDGARDYLYVVRDGAAHRVDVRVGPHDDAVTVVRSGLRAGDTVVAEKVPAIGDGTRVAPDRSPG